MTAPPSGFVEDIKASAHMRFEWRPVEYRADGIESLSQLRSTIESAVVRARGWDFPHVEKESGFETGGNYIGSWNSHFDEKEYWRFYCSRQFVAIARLRETVIGAHAWYRNNWQLAKFGPFKAGDSDTHFIDLVNTVWSIAERIDFAHRLAKATDVSHCRLVLSLKNVDGIHLLAEPNRSLRGRYSSASSAIEWSKIVGTAELMAGWRDVSASCAVYIVERFGWLDVSVEVLRSIVDQLYEL